MSVIWKDEKDEQSFHVGAKTKGGRITIWATLFEDGVYDLFGGEFLQKIKELRAGEVIEVNFTAVL